VRQSGANAKTYRFGGGLALVLSLGAFACESPSGPERELSGKQIYDRNCARCHGLEGKPTPESPSARDLSNESYINSLSDEAIRRAIEGGKPPAMPAFGGQFMEPSMKLVISYVRELSQGKKPAATDTADKP
jgi:mono/diheme cytochrome c family protein